MAQAEMLQADEAGIARAAAHLQAGRLVAFPTETVYGLGADARNGAAVARIFAAKNRPDFNPLIVHVPDINSAARLIHLDGPLGDLAHAFWPGPLTLVGTARTDNGIATLTQAGLPTLAVRVPAHPLASRLLAACDCPVAAPSANPSGRISPTQAAHVVAGLGARIDAILDGGNCPVGVESTIIGAADGALTLLRAGGIPLEALRDATAQEIGMAVGGDITAPGQMRSHYAPGAAMRLNALEAVPGEVHLGFGDISGDINLSETGDLIAAAARLFSALHELDATGKPIAVAPIPETGLGRAINDRLARAAAPRPQ